MKSSFLRGAALVIGGAFLVAAFGHAYLLARVNEARFRAKLELLARQGAVQLRDAGAASESRFRSWAWSALQDGAVVNVSLREESGGLIHSVPPDDDWLPAYTEGWPGVSWTRLRGIRDSGSHRTLWEAGAPLPPSESPAGGRWVVVLAKPDSWREGQTTSIAGFAGLLAGMGVLALAALSAWFERRVRRPILALCARAGAPTPHRPPQAGGEARDELALLALSIDELAERARWAEERAEHSERHVHSRVEGETRRIHLMLRRAERAAWLDPLTQLGNRRFLDDRLEQLFAAHREEERDLAVVMMDLDNFKQLNDSRGHSAGDDLLRFIGELLRGSLRPDDLGIRYGGDEFAIILPDTDAAHASTIAERIVRLFGQRTSVMELSPPVQLSSGIASLRGDRPETARQLLELADRALYASKSRGRAALCACD